MLLFSAGGNVKGIARHSLVLVALNSAGSLGCIWGDAFKSPPKKDNSPSCV